MCLPNSTPPYLLEALEVRKGRVLTASVSAAQGCRGLACGMDVSSHHQPCEARTTGKKGSEMALREEDTEESLTEELEQILRHE